MSDHLRREARHSAYSSAALRSTSERLTALLVEYFESAAREPRRTLPWRSPAELLARARERMAEAPVALDPSAISDRLASLAREMLETNNRLHSPHYMGHQVPPSVPLGGLFEVLGSATNEASGLYEMGPFPSAAERALVIQLGSLIGWKEGDFDGFATHGGSVANLTALLAARNSRFPDVWEKGVAHASREGRRPAVIASADAHYSIARAAGIIGLGADQVVPAPLDSRRRMDPERLPSLWKETRARGLEPFALIASSCATPIGAFDPIEPLAGFAREHGLWLHVDGAHGASTLLSRKHRCLVQGIERADSVTWDAHKMMFAPALCTFLLFRERARSYEAFRQDAPYLFDPVRNPTAEFDSAVRTLECTKRPLAMATWALWATFGQELFEELIDTTFAAARAFHDLLVEAADFVPLHEPECNILCFRYLPESLQRAPASAISDFQSSLRRRLVEGGQFYITATRIEGAMALRVVITNPFTERRHFAALLEEIREQGRKLREG